MPPQPPKCKTCGKVEWNHVCTGVAEPEMARRVTNVTKNVTLSQPIHASPMPDVTPVTKAVTRALEAENERLTAEVARLKRELAEANAKLAGMDGFKPKPMPMTAAERKRKQRAA